MLEKFDAMEKTENMFYIVAVKDELTKTFMQPTFGDNMDAIKRIFTTQVRTLPIWKDNPTDFSLYLLGYFNQETGEIVSNIEKIASGYYYKKENEE